MWAGHVGRAESDQPIDDDDERFAGRRDAGDGMNAPAEQRSPNLFDILRSRVRALSDGQLVLCASLGLAGLVVLGIIQRWPWAGIAACGALLGAGLWGILDRTRGAPFLLGRAVPMSLVTAARFAAGTLALISLLVLLLGAFGLCLGTWIS